MFRLGKFVFLCLVVGFFWWFLGNFNILGIFGRSGWARCPSIFGVTDAPTLGPFLRIFVKIIALFATLFGIGFCIWFVFFFLEAERNLRRERELKDD